MKEEKSQLMLQKYKKNYKKTLWTIIYWQTEQPGRNEHISTNITGHQNWIKKKQHTLKRPITWSKTECAIKKNKTSLQTKAQDLTAPQANSIRHTKKNSYWSLSKSSKDYKGGSTPTDILWRHYYPDTKTR